MGNTIEAISKLLKDSYEGTVVEHFLNEYKLLNIVTNRGSKDITRKGFSGGAKVIQSMQLDIPTSGQWAADGEELLDPDAGIYETNMLDVAYVYAVAGWTGPAEAKSSDDRRAFAAATTQAVKESVQILTHIRGRSVWLNSTNKIDQIATGGVTDNGDGTFTVQLKNAKRTLTAKFLRRKERVQLTADLVNLKAGSWRVSKLTKANGTITLSPVGTPVAPAAGDSIIAYGSFNKGIQGIQQIIEDTTSTFQGLSPVGIEDEWTALRTNANGAVSNTLLEQVQNEVYARSGKTPDVAITTPPIERALHEELRTMYHITASKDDLQAGQGVLLPGSGVRLGSDNQCKRGSLFLFTSEDLQRHVLKEVSYLDNEGGGKAHRFVRADRVEIILACYEQLGVVQRNSHAEVYGISDDTNSVY